MSTSVTEVRAGAPEASLAVTALLACALVAAPAVSVAGWLHGAAGAIGALAGVGLAVIAFAGAGPVATWAARFGPTALAGAITTGVMLRLAFYLVALDLLSGVRLLHRPSLAVATACATVVTLACEIRAASIDSRYFWVQTPRGAAR